MKAFKLNVETLTTVEDIAAVLDGLGLVMRDDAPMFDALSKYFNLEVEAPAIMTEGEGEPIAQED
jgi:hypothetical protein